MNRLRLHLILSILLAISLLPHAGFALEEGQLGLAGQGGGVMLMGDPGDVVADNFVVGANIAYGVLDWLAVEIDGGYSYHDEIDKDESGKLRLQLIQASVGPRFTMGWRVASIWGSVAPGAIISLANVEYRDAGDDKVKKDQNTTVVSATAAVGVDFRIADAFRLGILGRGTYGFGDISYGSPDGTMSDAPILFSTQVRGTIVF